MTSVEFNSVSQRLNENYSTFVRSTFKAQKSSYTSFEYNAIYSTTNQLFKNSIKKSMHNFAIEYSKKQQQNVLSRDKTDESIVTINIEMLFDDKKIKKYDETLKYKQTLTTTTAHKIV